MTCDLGARPRATAHASGVAFGGDVPRLFCRVPTLTRHAGTLHSRHEDGRGVREKGPGPTESGAA